MANPIVDAFVWGAGGAKKTPEQVAREREIAEAILMKAGNTSPVGHWTQGAARVVDALGGVLKERRAAAGEAEIADVNKGLISSLLSGSGSAPASSPASSSAIPMSGAAGEVSSTAPSADFNVDPTIKTGIAETAAALGIAPADLATAISYETAGTFDPMKAGPTTQWGQHKGLIQFGEPQAQQYGVDWSNPVGSQLGPEGAVAKYLREAGVKPGMGLMDIYSAINAGRVGRNDASDANNGGAPGTVAEKVNEQMAGHRAKALTLFPEQVASATPEAAIEAISPTQGGSLTDEVAAFEQTPAYSAQFPGQAAQGGLRPFRAGESRPNPDGSYSTEITTTWQLPDGSWVNVPSLWMGTNGPQQFSPDDEGGILGAMQTFEAQNGPAFQRFGSEQEAVAAAEARSQAGGAGAGQQGAVPQLSAPVEVPALPVAGPQDAVAQAITQQPVEVAGGGGRQGGINPAIIEALTNPQASPQTQRIAAILLEQEQRKAEAAEEQRLQAADPIRQLQLQKGQLELEQMRNPGVDGVAVGNRIVDRRTGKVVYEAPEGGSEQFRAATPEEAQRMGAAAGQFGPDGRFYPLNPPQGTSLQVDPTTGAVTFNQGAGVKPLTEAQSKDTVYATRATNALPLLDKYEGALLSLSENVSEGIPLNLGNYVQTEEYQVARDAGKDFVATILRKDSGAAITANEEKIYGAIFLPQPGDKPARLQAKRQRRALAVEAIKAGMPVSAVENMAKALEAVPESTDIEIQTDIPGVKIKRKSN